MDPLPDFVGDWMVARWMGVTKSDLDEMPIHEIEEARIVMAALNQAEHEAHQKASKKR